MLAEKDLDLVLIATPDHWHALPTIEAMRPGADLYLQKPISVDVVEGPGDARRRAQVQARRAGRHAAPQHAAPRSTRATASSARASSARSGFVEIYCYYHMRAAQNPPDTAPPANLDYEMWTGPAPMRPYNPHGAPARLARLHGVRQRHRRRHVHPHARHGALDARPGHAHAHRLDRRHPRRQGEQGEHQPTRRRRRSTSPTCRSSGRIAPGATRPIRSTRGALTLYGDKGTLKASVMGYDFVAARRRPADPRGRRLRARAVPGGHAPRRISSGTSRRRSAGT